MCRAPSMMRATVSVLIACAAVLIGCTEHIERRDVRSPDGRLTLRLEINESGGAAVPDVTSVFLLSSQPPGAGGKLIFRGSAMSQFDAIWGNSRQVILSFQGGYVSTCVATVMLAANVKVAVMGCK